MLSRRAATAGLCAVVAAFAAAYLVGRSGGAEPAGAAGRPVVVLPVPDARPAVAGLRKVRALPALRLPEPKVATGTSGSGTVVAGTTQTQPTAQTSPTPSTGTSGTSGTVRQQQQQPQQQQQHTTPEQQRKPVVQDSG